MVQVKAQVLLNRRIAPDHYRMRLKAPVVASRTRPGVKIYTIRGQVS